MKELTKKQKESMKKNLAKGRYKGKKIDLSMKKGMKIHYPEKKDKLRRKKK